MEKRIRARLIAAVTLVLAAGCSVPTPVVSPEPTPTATPDANQGPSAAEVASAAAGRLIRVPDPAGSTAEILAVDMVTGASRVLWPATDVGARMGVHVDQASGFATYWHWTPSPWRGVLVRRMLNMEADEESLAVLTDRVGFAGLATSAGQPQVAFATISPDPGLVREAADADVELSLYLTDAGADPPAAGAEPREGPAANVVWSASLSELGFEGAGARLLAWTPTTDGLGGRALFGLNPADADVDAGLSLLVVALDTGEVLRRHDGVPAVNLAASPDGRMVAIGQPDGLALLDVTTGDAEMLAQGARVEGMVWDPAGSRLAWEEVAPDTGEALAIVTMDLESRTESVIGGASGERRLLSFDPTGRYVAVASLDGDGRWAPRILPVAGGPAGGLDWSLEAAALPGSHFWWVVP